MAVISGLEAFIARPPDIVRGARLGLLTNPASVDRQLRPVVDLLASSTSPASPVSLASPASPAPGSPNGAWRLTRLFAPEHGLRGDYPAGDAIADGVDPHSGLPVTSLYPWPARAAAALLGDVDAVVVDLQQVGVRFFTRQVIAANLMEACARAGRPVVVLDRPNPIGGVGVEGPLLEPGFESVVGRAGQPVRHGLTLGEYLQAVNLSEKMGAELMVVPVSGWQRHQWWDETGLPWIMPSPNMPTLDSAAVYPGSCLLEGTVLSEGRGTTRPFELVGAPWIEPYRWEAALEERALPGVRFRALWFRPVSGKHAGQVCGGVQLHVTDRETFRPVAAGVHLIETARRLWPAEFAWRALARPGAIPAIDRLYGSAALREQLDAGESAGAIIAGWDVASFLALRQRVLGYE